MSLRIKHSSLHTTAFKPEDFPGDDPGEIAFAGKSNVGKSSLLNRIMGTKKLVKVSGRPGFTRSINFYSIIIADPENGTDKDAFFVDLPGYGYARAPKSVQKKWERLIGAYFSAGRDIRGVVTIFDIRRNPDALDLELLSFLKYHGISIIPVLNKRDKIGGGKVMSRTTKIHRLLEGLGANNLDLQNMLSVSARTNINIERFRELLLNRLI